MSLSCEKVLSIKFKRGEYDGKSFSYILRAEKKDLRLSAKTLDELLKKLILNGEIYCENDVYHVAEKKPQPEKTVVGKLRCNGKGFGFVAVEGDKDYYVSPENLGQSLNGDTVECKVLPGKKGVYDAAEVVKIVERGVTNIVGVFFTEGDAHYVRPDDKAYFADIYVPNDKTCGAENGDKVYLTIKSFPKNRCPEGEIKVVIGKKNDFSVEEESLLYSSGVLRTFDAEVKEKATAISQKIDDNEVIGRLDLRNEAIFTIDGDSSKDFDDAVSLSTDDDGNFILGVHIADVTAYVKSNDVIDKEAFERGTSVYLPDRVIPMLPFELSDGICSLNEGEDRLTLSVICKIDAYGNVLDRKISKSVIRSVHRMTYNNVDKILSGDEELREKYADILPVLERMNELRLILEKKRREQGYVELDVHEGDITLCDGKIDVKLHRATPATKLIEQFMVLANEQVAEFLSAGEYPCVYRVHEKPSEEKIEALKTFLNAVGITVNWKKNKVTPYDFAKLLKVAEELPAFGVVNRTVLRSMQKAFYSTENLGHFGLASQCYCHFTSPIRRYPDLATHRVLKAVLEGRNDEITDLYADFCQISANHSSKREKIAEECERNVDDLYKAKFLEDKIGEKFCGVISGVLGSGFFVELENTCEGFVPLELLPNGHYVYDPSAMKLFSKQHSFSLGQSVEIVVASVLVAERRVDFALVGQQGCKNKKSMVK